MYLASAGWYASSCVGISPYKTSVVSIIVPSSFFHVIVDLLAVYIYFALYSASQSTTLISGSHHANVYVYFSSAGCVISSCVGISPYATCVVSLIVQSSFFHVIVYIWTHVVYTLSSCSHVVYASCCHVIYTSFSCNHWFSPFWVFSSTIFSPLHTPILFSPLNTSPSWSSISTGASYGSTFWKHLMLCHWDLYSNLSSAQFQIYTFISNTHALFPSFAIVVQYTHNPSS